MTVQALVRIASFGLATMLAGASSAGAAPAGPPIKIGLAVGLTGYLAAADASVAEGVKIAVQEINSHGGVNGSPIELTVLDTASSAANAVTVANQLLNQTQVDILIGGANSASTAALVPLVTARKVPFVVGSVTPPDQTWVFSVLPKGTFNASLQVGYAKKQGAKTVGIIYSNTPYGQSIAKLLNDGAVAAGLTVAGSEGIDPTSTDLSPQLAKLADNHAEMILDVLTGPAHLILAKNAAAAGRKITLVMAGDNTETIRQATDIYPNIVFVATPPQLYPNIPRPALEKANETYFNIIRKFGIDKSVGIDVAGRGYDALYLIAGAIEAAKAHTGDPVRLALESMQPWQGSSGLYKYTSADHYGFQYNPMTIAGFRNGKLVSLYGE